MHLYHLGSSNNRNFGNESCGTGYWGMRMIDEEIVKDLDSDGVIAQHAGRARANVLGLRRFEKDVFINIAHSDKVENYYKQWNEEKASTEERIKALEKVATDPKDKEQIKLIKDNLALYAAGFNKVYGMIRDGRVKTTAEANAAIGEFKDESHKMEGVAAEFAKEGYKRLDHIKELAADRDQAGVAGHDSDCRGCLYHRGCGCPSDYAQHQETG